MKLTITLFILAIISLNTFAQDGYKIGDIATDFSLRGTDDKIYSLTSFDNAKGFVIIFTCNHCPYSKAYEDRIIALQNKYKEKGIEVIAINPNNPASYEADSFENMKIRAKEKNFNFPYLFDDGQKIFPKYGATKTPHVFLLNADKKVEYIGAIDNSTEESTVSKKYLEDAIDALLAGKKIKVTTTKAIGCSIKK